MKKKINKVQELKSSGVQESTLKPLNPVNVEPVKSIVSRIIDVT